jgi:hypothetical protein
MAGDDGDVVMSDSQIVSGERSGAPNIAQLPNAE